MKFSVVFLLSLSLTAETTRTWRQDRIEDFEKGTATGVSLRSDGRLLLAPTFRAVGDPQLNYVWDMVEDSRGRLYVGGGSPGKVVRLTPKLETVFTGKELEIHALAVDNQDNVYAATSPDPKIYKITPEGKSSVFYEPKAKYVWALAWDPSGYLYVATGDQGEIFRVDRDGKGKVFFNIEDTHVRALVLEPKTNNLILGTDPSGLILRVTPAPEGTGKGFVVYQANKKEITALAIGPDGSIYASAVGDKPPRTTPMAGAPAPPPPPVPSPIFIPSLQAPPPVQGGTDVYRILPDGSPRRIWWSREDVVYSISFSAAGKPLLGAGNKGKLFQLDSDNLHTVLLRAPATQVTALHRTAKGQVYAGTGNIGKVFELGSEYEREGSFESEVFDTRNFSRWGRVHWENQMPAGTVLSLMTRTGNVDNPDRNWSPWSRPYRNAAGEMSGNPGARFVQWKAVFTANTGKSTPLLDEVEIAYLSKNLAPVLDEIEATPGGYRFNIVMPPPPSQQPATIMIPALGQPRTPPPPPPQPFAAPQQMTAQRGAQAVRWAAHDDNDDQLVFSVYIRGANETTWKLMKDKISDRFYSWDASSLPDGFYVTKVVVSDSPSNTEQDALSDEKESQPFEIDNTPPRIANLSATREGRRVRVRFHAADAMSVIRRAEYSVDTGDWQVLQPVDGLSDSLEEDYNFVTAELAPGEHSIAVRVADKVENVQVDKVVVK